MKCFNWCRLVKRESVICCFCVKKFATKQELNQHCKDEQTCLAFHSDICDILQNNYHDKTIIKIRERINRNNKKLEQHINAQKAKHGALHDDNNIPITPLPIYTSQQQTNIINNYSNLAPRKLSFDSMDENDSLDNNNINLRLYQNAEQYFTFLAKLCIISYNTNAYIYI